MSGLGPSPAPPPGGVATLNYNGLIGFNATDPYAITAESRSGAFSLSLGTQVLMCLFYGILAFTAITSNMIVSYIVLSSPKMRTATNFFIVNLALGDILMAMLCIPFTFPANLIFQYWPFGLSLCVIVSYSQANSVFISAYTMVAISIDKYMAIMYPMRLRMPKTQAKLIILAIWSAALLTSLPTALLSSLAPDSAAFESQAPATTTNGTRNQMGPISAEPVKEQQQQQQQQQRKYFCQESWSFWPPGQYYYSMALMILQFVLPLFVLVITYSRIVIIVWGKRMPGEEDNARDARMARSKRKMIKMVMLCVIAFALTWLPFNALIVIGDIQPDIWEHENIMLIWFVTHYLAMCHTITNPLIYIWMNDRFRQGFRQVIGDLCWQGRRLLTLGWFHCCCCGCLLRGPRLRCQQQVRQMRQQRARRPPGNCALAHHPNQHHQQPHATQTQTQAQNQSQASVTQQQRRCLNSSSTNAGTGSGNSNGEQGAGQAPAPRPSEASEPAKPELAAGSGPKPADKTMGGERRRQRQRPHQIQIQMVVRGSRKSVELGPGSDHSSCTNSPATNTTSLSLTQQQQQQPQQPLQHRRRRRRRQVPDSSGSRSLVAGLESEPEPERAPLRMEEAMELESGDSRATDEDVCELEAFKSRSRSQSQSHAMLSSRSQSRSLSQQHKQKQYHPAHSKSNNNVSQGAPSGRQVKSNGSLELLSDEGRSSEASDQEERRREELESEFGDGEGGEDEDEDSDVEWPRGAQVFEMATLTAPLKPRAPTRRALAQTSSAHVNNDRADYGDGGRPRLLARLFRSAQDDLCRRRSPGRRHRRHHSNGRRQDRSLRRAMLLNNHLLTCSLRRIPSTLGDSSGDGSSLGAHSEPDTARGPFEAPAPGCPGTNQSSPPSQPQAAGSVLFRQNSHDSDRPEQSTVGGPLDAAAKSVLRKSPTVYLINGRASG